MLKENIVWCSTKEESKDFVEFANGKGYRWFDLSNFRDVYEKGGVGYNLENGCHITKEQKKELAYKYNFINYEDFIKELK